MSSPRVVYHLHSNIAHVSHALPLYNRLGGMFYSEYPSIAAFVRAKYPHISVTTEPADVREYRPDLALYSHYTWLDFVADDVRHVQIFHDISDKPYNYASADSERYDLCLCAGQLQIDKFRAAGRNGRYRAVGYPKFDLPVDELDLPFPDDRPLVLYAPTWGVFSTIAAAAEPVIRLAERFNVLVKAHPLIAWGDEFPANEAAIHQLIAAVGERLFVASDDNIIPFLTACDILLCDAGTVLYEYLPQDKPQIILSEQRPTPPDDLLAPRLFFNYAMVVRPERLDNQLVADVLDRDPFIEMRRDLRRRVYHHEPGKSASDLAVAAILELLGR
ncbi:MAG: CDP-glycerol glycerophosphotransferase family protein [Myxococcota bacterium]